MSKHRDGKYGGGRWARNKATADYLSVSVMTLWRWKNDPALKFPPPPPSSTTSNTTISTPSMHG